MRHRLETMLPRSRDGRVRRRPTTIREDELSGSERMHMTDGGTTTMRVAMSVATEIFDFAVFPVSDDVIDEAGRAIGVVEFDGAVLVQGGLAFLDEGSQLRLRNGVSGI